MRTTAWFARTAALTIIAAAVSFGVLAQTTSPAKRPVAHTDFDSWRTIATPMLSRDGKWMAYSIQPQDGDGELVWREIQSGKEARTGVGLLPPPVTTPNEENPDAPPVPRAIRAAFTSDGRFLVATTYPSKADTVAARKARKSAQDMPKGGALIVDLASGEVTRLANVKSIHVPAKGGAWLAVLKEEAKPEPAKPAADASALAPASAPASASPKAANDIDDEESDQTAAQQRRATNVAAASGAAAAGGAASTAPRVIYGTELVLMNLADKTERSLANVLEVFFARDGKALVYAVGARADADNGVYTITPGDSAAPVPLLTGKGKYVKLAWDRAESQLAFLSDRDDAAAKTPRYKAWHWVRGSKAAQALDTVVAGEVAKGMQVSERGTLAFSRNGRMLYVPLATPAKAPRDPQSLPTDEDKVVADLWHWNDDHVQSIQRVRAVQERNRTYRAAYDLASKKFTPLADETLRTVSLSDDGTRAIGIDDRAWRKLTDFDGSYIDVYLVDTTNGARRKVLTRLRESPAFVSAQWSPDGKWVAYWQDRHWHLLDTAKGTTRNLTASLKRAFHNEEQDTPGVRAPYGSAGWTSDSQSLLVYDRDNVWQLFAEATGTTNAAKNLTVDAGRQENIRFRVQRVEAVDEDDDERGIDAKAPLTLRGESELTRASGFWRTSFDAKTAPVSLVRGDANYRFVSRARESDTVLMTASRFERFPELQVTNAGFEKPQVVTEVGKQMAAFTWGSNELVAFKNKRGQALQATLYKPDGFDAKKKYPMMVYIYERLTQNRHNFVNPAPSNGLNIALYVSNGYVVLTPDIAYTTGQPGKDALDTVLPAMDVVVKQGFIDEKRIGIQGHSWGGYQIAWMVTQTNRFRAAEAGAPVGNMTSAYSGIRWGSGLPRQFQYEKAQSRIGPNLYDATPLYIAASPIFQIKKVTTPLLILSNDADDAVPWYQGIELFLALRRFGKEAYMFNYNGQLHNLRRRADQKDFALRMHQYFDHFLKDAPKPEWMEKGISFIDREEEKERFLKAATGATAAKP